MTYGLNNNTGMGYQNSNNNFAKLSRSITSTASAGAENAKQIFSVMNDLKNFQNAKSGGEKAAQIASTIAKLIA